MRDCGPGGRAGGAAGSRPRVLVVDADPALLELLGEWLAADGCDVFAGVAEPLPRGTFDLILIDVPFPRLGRPSSLRGVVGAHPGTPIVALSSTLLAEADGTGAIARGLGVASILAKPVKREALMGVVRKLALQASR